MRPTLIALFLCFSTSGVRAAEGVPVSASADAGLSPLTATDLYQSQRIRDPFLQPGAASVVEQSQGPVEFSIHGLSLKGILRDETGQYAILVEAGSGASYILKGGKLYNSKRKLVRGVTGTVKLKQKTVHLMTPDKDVQTLILGEDTTKEKEGL